MIKYISIFSILFFLMHSIAHALPFIGAVPFIFELGVLLYSFITILCTGLLLSILKYIKFYSGVLVMLVITTSIFFSYYVSFEQVSLVRLGFTFGDIEYTNILIVYTIFILAIGATLLKIKRRLYQHILLIGVSVFVLLINISLIYSSVELSKRFEYIKDEFNILVNSTLTEDSHIIKNNIFVSQDFGFTFEGKIKKCRITVSEYIHEGIPHQKYANKGNSYYLLTGLDRGLCRELIYPIFNKVIQKYN